MFFKRSKIIFFSSVVISTIALAGVVIVIGIEEGSFLAKAMPAIILLVCILLAVFLLWMENRETKRLLNRLHEDCRPEETYPEFERIAGQQRYMSFYIL